ncbi:hypothetical protein D3C72_1979190 [compost metagenome]
MSSGDFNNPTLMGLMELQKYFTELLGAQHMGQAQAIQRAYAENQGVRQELSNESAINPVDAANIDFISDPNLTDEQKYDILQLTDSKSWTPAQIEFSNGPGFAIKMTRNKLPTKVGENDL